MTLAGLEAEYSFGYTKITGEWIHDSFATPTGDAIANAWFVQGTQTLSPRVFVAARREHTSAPVLGSSAPLAAQPDLDTFEATAGVRVTPDVTLRGSYFSRKSYGRSDWDHQAAASFVCSRRWR